MPDSIGRYQITGELGSGAMGVVYRATDPMIGRTIALKTIRAELVGQSAVSLEQLAQRFRNEARAAGSMNHRNIVTIYDAGEDQGTFFIAMEYLEGTTLQQLIAQRRSLRSDEVVGIGTQICAGLDYAHARGIVHRDVKPANIIITGDGTVKITDFGIAKAEEALAAQMTLTGQILGTPDYMSPEQVKGLPLDGRSDLFSLGVVLYQMATGERPFPGQSVTTVIYKIVHETPTAPHALDASVPAGLSAVIMRALAKSPDARFQTARDLNNALSNYSEALYTGETAVLDATIQRQQPATPMHAGDQPRVEKHQNAWVKRSVLWPVAGLLIAALAMLLSTWEKRQQQPPAPPSTPASSASSAPSSPSTSPSSPPSNPRSSSNSSSTPGIPTPALPPIPSVNDMTQQALKMGEEASKSAGVDVSKAIEAGAPTEAAHTGVVVVNSNPPGAEIVLEQYGAGKLTPARLTVPAGKHELVLMKGGYLPATRSIEVKPSQVTRVKVDLPRVPVPPER